MRTSLIRPLLALLGLLLTLPAPLAAAPPEEAEVFAALNYSALQPGQQSVIAVVLDVPEGFHAQSHTPLDENLIPLVVELNASPGVKLSPPLYPQGKVQDYPLLGKVSVYTDRAIIYVPLEVASDAPAGPITLSGKITYQLCDDQSCLPPETKDFSLPTQVIPAGQLLVASHPKLFAGFDPTTFARSQAGSSAKAQAEPEVTLFGQQLGRHAYVLAFLGAFVVGMIFNVMPCVLPIVPLKAMGFYQAAQEHRGRSLALGATFAAGVIATFGALAIMVVVLRLFAWGQLFGNPYFAGAIVLILVGLALGQFGLFGVVLPSGVYRFAPQHDTYVGNFLFGILTAILSTPCTFGMFLGLLVWASAQNAAIGTALIMVVGVGMAFPYLVLAALPELAKRFPRTGPWAEIVKQMMAFLLIATAVYFGRRFMPESLGDRGFWWIMFGIVAASAVFLIGRTLLLTRRPLAIGIASGVAFFIVVPALAVTMRLTYIPIDWVKYSSEALEQARRSGKPVLVKFTATWCGNCQAIEATVFVDPRTVDAIKRNGVVMIKADLTRPDAPGWDLLRALHPVAAIPFTAVYLPNTEDPRKLAGIYSTDDLLRSFERT